MSLLRVPRTLFRPFPKANSGIRISRFSQTSCLIRQFQGRGNNSHPRDPQGHQPEPNVLRPDRIYAARNDGEYEFPDPEPEPELPYVRVRYLRPAIWAASVSAGIYVFLAYLEAKEQLKPKPFPNPFRDYIPRRQTPPTPTEVATRFWSELNPISKLSVGIIATNGAVHLGKLAPNLWGLLWHIPARNVNYTLFTSMFVHSGLFHFGFNMWACWNFLLPVGYSRMFEGQPLHTLSFYLSAGLLSGYAQHLSTIFTRQAASAYKLWIPSGGASGALFAIFGAFCMQYPHQSVGIVFLPFSFEAQSFLPFVMLFDLIGMIRPYSFASLGHAAHLSGTLLGVAYSSFDGKEKLWKPLVRFWKRQLQ
ncbi:hypothetical protein BS50DRAFT_141701 [Corynespora cassiicola Philippines]|uniref:Peptidase S54 rhomboid domain-containing protein n=1 Tax=Corynespora cassiicola Philippines TaxID=1448308 RepID=A0A2T2NB60_CORCC|nr:hypothetical protein BS50DRAFT_141701 [Corynespora cassiicola Philippines]